MKNLIIMLNKKVRLDLMLNFTFLILLWIFFGIFYKYHLLFKEQQQLFLFTSQYFYDTVNNPGGLLVYIGEFLTQFYYIPYLGAIIITALLMLFQQATKKWLNNLKENDLLYPLTFLPALSYAILLSNDLYYLSGLIGFIVSLYLSICYFNIQNRQVQFVFGILLIPTLNFFIGGAYILFVALIILKYLLKYTKIEKKRIFWLSVASFSLIAVFFPLLIHNYWTTTVLKAYLSTAYYKIDTVLPLPLIGIALLLIFLSIVYSFVKQNKTDSFRNRFIFISSAITIFSIAFLTVLNYAFWGASNFVSYDYYARNGEWKEIVKKAKKENPTDQLSLIYLNLALSYTGNLGNEIFSFKQTGQNGLFVSDNNKSFEPFLVGNELYFHLGLVNFAQYFAFEAMELLPDHKKNVRCIKRLVETNIINERYEVAKKYISLLENTLFYRKWAIEARTYLYNDKKIINHPEWGILRKLRPVTQYFFTFDQIEVILRISIKDNPQNSRAFEYLMTFYLLNKDLEKFKAFYSFGKNALHSNVPTSFQEAIIYIISHQVEQLNSKNTPNFINPQIVQRLKAYANIYTTFPNPREQLEKEFRNTFWFYLHFR